MDRTPLRPRGNHGPSRVRMLATIELLFVGAGIATGIARAVVADMFTGIKNGGRAFSESHRRAYRERHIVKRRV